MTRKRRRALSKRRTGPPYVPCGACSTGWVTRIDGTVVRCWCFKAHQKTLDSQPPEKGNRVKIRQAGDSE